MHMELWLRPQEICLKCGKMQNVGPFDLCFTVQCCHLATVVVELPYTEYKLAFIKLNCQ
jgi:hypothetical protein